MAPMVTHGEKGVAAIGTTPRVSMTPESLRASGLWRGVLAKLAAQNE
jgi:hypothetical protein